MRIKALFILVALAVPGLFIARTCRLYYFDQSTLDPGLSRVIDEVRFTDTPLEAALVEWSRKSGLKLEVDWDELEKIDVEPNSPVTLRLFSLPASIILQTLLDQACPPNQTPISYTHDGLANRVTTRDAIVRHLELRMYDVGQIVERFGIPSEVRLKRGSDEYKNRFAAVEYLISQHASNKDWYLDGLLCEWQGCLFVRQTAVYQRSIERALSKLRQMEGATPQLRPMIGPIPSLNDE